MQLPFTARVHQSISNQSLQHQIPARSLATGRQLLGPKPIQLQLFIQLGGQPTRPPLPRPFQLKVLEADLYDLLAADRRGSLLREQSHGLGLDLTVFENLDRLAPCFLPSFFRKVERKNMAANYAKIRVGGKGAGLHYRTFEGFSKLLALKLRKLRREDFQIVTRIRE